MVPRPFLGWLRCKGDVSWSGGIRLAHILRKGLYTMTCSPCTNEKLALSWSLCYPRSQRRPERRARNPIQGDWNSAGLPGGW